MPRTIAHPDRLLGAFFVLLFLPFAAGAAVGLRVGANEGPLASALALVPPGLFLAGFAWVASRFRAAPDAMGLLGLVSRLLGCVVVAAFVPAGVVLCLHAVHVRAEGTYVAVPTSEGLCLVQRVETPGKPELRTGGDHPAALLPALHALSASRDPLTLVAPTMLIGVRARTYQRTAVRAQGTVVEVYGTRAGRRAWALVRNDHGETLEVPLLSLCVP